MDPKAPPPNRMALALRDAEALHKRFQNDINRSGAQLAHLAAKTGPAAGRKSVPDEALCTANEVPLFQMPSIDAEVRALRETIATAQAPGALKKQVAALEDDIRGRDATIVMLQEEVVSLAELLEETSALKAAADARAAAAEWALEDLRRRVDACPEERYNDTAHPGQAPPCGDDECLRDQFDALSNAHATLLGDTALLKEECRGWEARCREAELAHAGCAAVSVAHARQREERAVRQGEYYELLAAHEALRREFDAACSELDVLRVGRVEAVGTAASATATTAGEAEARLEEGTSRCELQDVLTREATLRDADNRSAAQTQGSVADRSPEENGATPLILAARENLVIAGADVNAADNTGITALMRAALFDHRISLTAARGDEVTQLGAADVAHVATQTQSGLDEESERGADLAGHRGPENAAEAQRLVKALAARAEAARERHSGVPASPLRQRSDVETRELTASFEALLAETGSTPQRCTFEALARAAAALLRHWDVLEDIYGEMLRLEVAEGLALLKADVAANQVLRQAVESTEVCVSSLAAEHLRALSPSHPRSTPLNTPASDVKQAAASTPHPAILSSTNSSPGTTTPSGDSETPGDWTVRSAATPGIEADEGGKMPSHQPSSEKDATTAVPEGEGRAEGDKNLRLSALSRHASALSVWGDDRSLVTERRASSVGDSSELIELRSAYATLEEAHAQLQAAAAAYAAELAELRRPHSPAIDPLLPERYTQLEATLNAVLASEAKLKRELRELRASETQEGAGAVGLEKEEAGQEGAGAVGLEKEEAGTAVSPQPPQIVLLSELGMETPHGPGEDVPRTQALGSPAPELLIASAVKLETEQPAVSQTALQDAEAREEEGGNGGAVHSRDRDAAFDAAEMCVRCEAQAVATAAQLAALQDECCATHAALEESRAELRRAEQDKERQNVLIDAAQLDCDASKAEVARLEAAARALRVRNQELEAHNVAAHGNYVAARTAHEDLASAAAALEASHTKLTAAHEALQDEMAGVTAERGRLREEVGRLEGAKSVLEGTVAALSARFKALLVDVHGSPAAGSGWDDVAQTVQDGVRSLQAHATVLQERCLAVEAAGRRAAVEYAETGAVTQKMLADRDRQIAALQHKLAAAEEACTPSSAIPRATLRRIAGGLVSPTPSSHASQPPVVPTDGLLTLQGSGGGLLDRAGLTMIAELQAQVRALTDEAAHWRAEAAKAAATGTGPHRSPTPLRASSEHNGALAAHWSPSRAPQYISPAVYSPARPLDTAPSRCPSRTPALDPEHELLGLSRVKSVSSTVDVVPSDGSALPGRVVELQAALAEERAARVRLEAEVARLRGAVEVRSSANLMAEVKRLQQALAAKEAHRQPQLQLQPPPGQASKHPGPPPGSLLSLWHKTDGDASKDALLSHPVLHLTVVAARDLVAHGDRPSPSPFVVLEVEGVSGPPTPVAVESRNPEWGFEVRFDTAELPRAFDPADTISCSVDVYDRCGREPSLIGRAALSLTPDLLQRAAASGAGVAIELDLHTGNNRARAGRVQLWLKIAHPDRPATAAPILNNGERNQSELLPAVVSFNLDDDSAEVLPGVDVLSR
eukprot:TRINITY_DN2374_c0_g2_i1.p1 TRINITY_DN2374_c0_g2~~TRINITY_DN2374_c0_g2_i1.p1  ORF type:complete len:1585 (+),score=337.01 TRINITY_DN2374_c0_g2_i1:69-4823(+)